MWENKNIMIIFSHNWDWVTSIVNTNFVCNNFLALKWVTHQLPFWHLTNSLLSFRLRDFQCTNHSHSNEQELKIKIIMFFCSWTIQKLATAATKKKEFASTNLPPKKVFHTFKLFGTRWRTWSSQESSIGATCSVSIPW